MRIGAFELNPVFRDTWCLAEVLAGKAPLLHACSLRNVRGTESDWLRIQARIGSLSTARVSVRSVAPGAEDDAAAEERRLLNALVLPGSLEVGPHDGRLIITASGNERAEIPFQVRVLPASQIPTDFARAAFLSSYVRTEDAALKRFAARMLADCPPEASARDVLHHLYDGLLKEHLMYQPVSTPLYPDHEPVMDPGYVVSCGGSCADLSLALASLLWMWDASPVLILYADHMSVGVLTADTPGFTVLRRPSELQELLDAHMLLPVESTGVCIHRQLPFDRAILEAVKRISSQPCCLVHVRECLRSGRAVPIPPERMSRVLTCPSCGFDHLQADPGMTEIICPACHTAVPLVTSRPRTPVSAPVYDPGSVRYTMRGAVAAAERLQPGAAGDVQVLPEWEGKTVSGISARAFENSRVSAVLLPDTVTEIGDRAFYGCTNLSSLDLPEDLSVIGSAAFGSSGLQRIRIPGSVRRIPRLAFSGCRKLMHVEIGEGVEFIDEYAFSGCPALASVTLPASLREACRNAFDPACQVRFRSLETRMK